MQQDILDYPQPLHGEVEKKRNMKTETVLAAVFVMGFLFKVQHWPLSGFLLFISLGTLFVIYFFLSFYFFSYSNIRTQNISLSIAGGIFLSFVPLAMLLNFQRWPGRGLFTLVGIASLIVFAVVYFMRRQSPRHLRYYYNNMMIRSAILAVIGLIMFLRWFLLWF